jgi:hypothetical protein
MARVPRVKTVNGPSDVSPTAKRVPVPVRKTEENWSQYHLTDGTVLRIRPAILEIMRITGHINAAGEPIYEVRGGMILDSKVPPRGRQKKK